MPGSADPRAHAALEIAFARGERPHVFWISPWFDDDGARVRYRVLSKRRREGALEVCITRQDARGARRAVARQVLDRDAPSGSLERWVREFADALGVPLRAWDVSHIASASEWDRFARERLAGQDKPGPRGR